jgi:hypothetical protein
VVPAHTHSITSPCSRNEGTTHDETGVEAEGRCRRVEIPSQSQHREGANVAAREETGVDSKKMIAPRCRGSRSRGGCGQETCNRSLFFGRGRRSSVNGRQGDTTNEQQQPHGRLASLCDRSSRGLARETDDNARFCTGQSGHARSRKEGVSVDPVGKATIATYSVMKTAI